MTLGASVVSAIIMGFDKRAIRLEKPLKEIKNGFPRRDFYCDASCKRTLTNYGQGPWFHCKQFVGFLLQKIVARRAEIKHNTFCISDRLTNSVVVDVRVSGCDWLVNVRVLIRGLYLKIVV